jgi:asparagine synthase (glutamine-hydrolysing)
VRRLSCRSSPRAWTRSIRAPNCTGLDLDARAGREQVGALEMRQYLQVQLLRDADAVSMAHSLELRTPLVDRDLLRAAMRVPASAAPRRTGQAPLREAPRVPVPARSGSGASRASRLRSSTGSARARSRSICPTIRASIRARCARWRATSTAAACTGRGSGR